MTNINTARAMCVEEHTLGLKLPYNRHWLERRNVAGPRGRTDGVDALLGGEFAVPAHARETRGASYQIKVVLRYVYTARCWGERCWGERWWGAFAVPYG